MNEPRNYLEIRTERGAVLIVVLIVATIFAVLAFITLQVSLHSLESTDRHANIYKARLIGEGGIDSGAARLRQDLGANPALNPAWLEPSFALSATELDLRQEFVNLGLTTDRQIEDFPAAFERTAYTLDSSVSIYSPDVDIVPGSHDDATYRYIDDTQFSEDYPAYEFTPVQSTGDLVVYGIGEVVEAEGDTTEFSFLQASFPNVQWNFDVREAGVTEPSRIGPYPYIETDHPYGNNQGRAWTVTFQSDPAHPGRSITDLRLLADINEVGIDPTDTLYISAWLEDEKRFQYPSEMLLPGQILGAGYWNPLNEVFSPKLDTTTIGLMLITDGAITDYGFRVSGVRYGFDSDEFKALYETPHPYDDIVPQANAANLNLQVIYSTYQAHPLDPNLAAQRMRIQFDPDFSLDAGDTLLLMNSSRPGAMAPVVIYDSVTPPPADGWSPQISRINSTLPLGFILLLARTSNFDTDGIQNYGYKVMAMEYVDLYGNIIVEEEPVMQSPHNLFLGANDTPYNIPAFLPFPPPPPSNYAGQQTIYRPFCPNVEDAMGVGTVDDWTVVFGSGSDLTATTGVGNNDYVRLTTPGNPLVSDGMTLYDTIYFVHPNGGLGPNIATSVQYFDIFELKDFVVNCGLAELLEIEFVSDTQDAYEASQVNYGFRVVQVGYTTTDGADEDRTPPTIRTDVNFPVNTGYPAFGSGAYETCEWWYSNPEAMVVGLHIDRFNFDLEPGDRIEFYDDMGVHIATVLSDSVDEGPSAFGPNNPDDPSGGQQHGQGPGASGPYIPGSVNADTVVDLNATYGWVLVPGTTAKVKFIGDNDENEGYSGFEIDHCGFVNGDVVAILNYLTDYTELAYGEYYDRSSQPMQAFRSLGND